MDFWASNLLELLQSIKRFSTGIEYRKARNELKSVINEYITNEDEINHGLWKMRLREAEKHLKFCSEQLDRDKDRVLSRIAARLAELEVSATIDKREHLIFEKVMSLSGELAKDLERQQMESLDVNPN